MRSSGSWEAEGTMQLTKHHGLSNDFLVVLDEVNGRAVPIDAELARRLCDRRTGIGADGLIRGSLPDEDGRAAGADVVMELRNGDGSRAEISGNGIRCLGQAVALARGLGEGELVVATDAGPRRLWLRPSEHEGCLDVSTTMGTARPGPPVPSPLDEELPARHLTVDVGNPHLVLEVPDPDVVDLATQGAWLEQQFPGGVNVEFVAVTGPDALALRVWERGAGITWACGSGACAAAHAAHQWGLVGRRVEVAMPGGTAVVELGDELVLSGPTCLVGTVEVPA
jgi:diaminopimelate epimerase